MRGMDFGEDEESGEDLESAKQFAARLQAVGPLVVGALQPAPGRSRRCAFWISPVVPPNTRYIVDSAQLLPGGSWTHNPHGDAFPEDTLLVVIGPKDADQIRKAMATWTAVPHPVLVAARIIDEECRKDPTLAGRMRWKVAS